MQPTFLIVLFWLPSVSKQSIVNRCGSNTCCGVYYPWWWIGGRIKLSLKTSFTSFSFCYLDGMKYYFKYRTQHIALDTAPYQNPLKNTATPMRYQLSTDIFNNDRPFARIFDTMARQEDDTNFAGFRMGTNLFEFGEYEDIRYHGLVSFVINLLLCAHKMNTRKTCPSPCRKPHMCIRDENSDGVCMKEVLKKKPSYMRNVFEKGYSGQLNKLYYYRGNCGCFKSYQYSIKKGFCEFKPKTCVVEDGVPPCRNSGKCEALPERLQPHDDIHERCLCPASWGGISCQLPRNPCGDYQHNPCGEFRCERSPENLYSGFKCMCTAGYRPRSVTDPVCEEIDECIEDEPCQHGGKCTNVKPPVSEYDIAPLRYLCKCIRGYTGEHCQIPPAEPSWATWGSWSTCSKTCGIGLKERQRNCTSMGKCMGIHRERVSCILLAAVCMDFHKETETWKAMRDEEENVNDAFHWNENNRNIQEIFMSNVAYYLSFVFLVLGSLTFFPLISLIIGLVVYHKRAMRQIAKLEEEEEALGLEFD